MAIPYFRIGVLMGKVDRKRNTVHRWEADGIIAEPSVRGGKISAAQRLYTKGEIDLIVESHRLWWEEHFIATGRLVPRPNMWRFGVLYWDMRQYLRPSRKYGYLVTLPDGGYKAPPVAKWDYDTKKDFWVSEFKDVGVDATHKEQIPGTLFDKVKEVSRLLRDDRSLRKAGQTVEARMDFSDKIFHVQSREEAISVLEEYKSFMPRWRIEDATRS
jgi:hypothetical protein